MLHKAAAACCRGTKVSRDQGEAVMEEEEEEEEEEEIFLQAHLECFGGPHDAYMLRRHLMQHSFDGGFIILLRHIVQRQQQVSAVTSGDKVVRGHHWWMHVEVSSAQDECDMLVTALHMLGAHVCTMWGHVPCLPSNNVLQGACR